jgi:catechol 2,3-dioxygenase-like lactoylglutathione lyase family enzyme
LRKPPLTRLHHLTLATQDVIASRQFFKNTFGWAEIRRPGNVEVEAAWLDIGDGQQLHLLRVEGAAPSPFEAEFGRHFAFDYPLAEFAPLKERLLAHGAELIAPIRETPFERFFFKEPNGYVFEVVDAARKPEA